jgi:hypothetical protein
VSFKETKETLERTLKSVSVNILVWGPGVTAGFPFEKREQIRRTIKEELPGADVLFSESPELEVLVPAGLSQVEQELFHLTWSDTCIVLDDSKGAGEEIAVFSRTNQAYKLFILTADKFKGLNTFPAAIRANLNQIFYSEDEYTSCSVTGRAVSHAKAIALNKLVDL